MKQMALPCSPAIPRLQSPVIRDPDPLQDTHRAPAPPDMPEAQAYPQRQVVNTDHYCTGTRRAGRGSRFLSHRGLPVWESQHTLKHIPRQNQRPKDSCNPIPRQQTMYICCNGDEDRDHIRVTRRFCPDEKCTSRGAPALVLARQCCRAGYRPWCLALYCCCCCCCQHGCRSLVTSLPSASLCVSAAWDQCCQGRPGLPQTHTAPVLARQEKEARSWPQAEPRTADGLDMEKEKGNQGDPVGALPCSAAICL